MDETLREYHEVSQIFPMIGEEEYRALKEDIAENGLLEPIWIDADGKIIDGRNRHKACIETNTPMRFEIWQDNGKLLDFVISKNLHRRHLTTGQRAVIAEKLANYKLGDNQYLGSANLPTHRVSQKEAAQKMNVSERSIRDVKEIKEEDPKLIEDIEAGKTTINEAKKQVKKKKREEKIAQQQQAIEENNFTPPTKLYDVISIDPPWPYGTKYDPDGRRAANPYPEMDIEDIKNIKLPHSENCVLWLWTTHKFMRHSFDILDHWGFRDVAIITWVKNKMGLGTWIRSQSEFCIMAVLGKPTINLTNQTTIIHGEMREHSRKPDEFYKMVDSLCVGYKCDYFSREERAGWDSFGDEKRKFNNDSI